MIRFLLTPQASLACGLDGPGSAPNGSETWLRVIHEATRSARRQWSGVRVCASDSNGNRWEVFRVD